MGVLSRLAAFVAVSAVLCLAEPALASVGLDAALRAHESAAEKAPNLSAEFKDALSQVTAALRSRDEDARGATGGGQSSVPAGPSAQKTFWDRLHPFADVSLRFEWDENRAGQGGDRTRGRARLRMGAAMT